MPKLQSLISLTQMLLLFSSILLASVQGLNQIRVIDEGQDQRGILEKRECIDTLYSTTSETNGILTQESFLDFARIISSGAIDEDSFDVYNGGGFPSPELFRLVNIYWITVCSIDPEGCADGEERVKVSDIVNYETSNGSSLADNFCERFDYLLEDIITQAPSPKKTQYPTKAPTVTPTSTPSKDDRNSQQTTETPTRKTTSNPTKKPTVAPSPSPTKKPTTSPTSNPSRKPAPNPTKGPTSNPTRRPTASPTKVPTSNPTRRRTVYPTRRPTKQSGKGTVAPTAGPTLSPRPTPTPTYGDDVDLTFSIEYIVTNPIQFVREWTIGLIENQLENADSSCSTRGVENNNCPYKYTLSVSLIKNECFGNLPDEYSCGLMDVSISVTSLERSDVGAIISEIDRTFRNSLSEVEDDLLKVET